MHTHLGRLNSIVGIDEAELLRRKTNTISASHHGQREVILLACNFHQKLHRHVTRWAAGRRRRRANGSQVLVVSAGLARMMTWTACDGRKQ